MEQPIRIPRHLTALLQHMQRLVVSGHYYWTSDRIPAGKLPGFIAKWQPGFQLRADAAARAYRRRTGRASVHLCIHPDYLGDDNERVDWWMLSTAGKEGLASAGQVPGEGKDCRTLAGRLRYRDYELLEQPKTFRDKRGRTKTVTTWTWRLTPTRYREWEALLVEHAKARDRSGVEQLFDCLCAMPMFAGVRAQAIRLAQEANRMLRKVKVEPVELPELPAMRMVKLWDEDGEL